MNKTLKFIGLLLLLVFVVMQFVRPEKNKGSIEGIVAFKNDTKPSEEVFMVLKQNCFDCHSDSTKYPWYAEVAPISYWLADHVKEAKGDFNMSAWETYSTKKKDHKLEELVEMVEEKEMPLPSYTWTHTEAKLTDAQIKNLLEWANKLRFRYSLELEAGAE